MSSSVTTCDVCSQLGCHLASISDYQGPASHLGGSLLRPPGCERADPESPSNPLLLESLLVPDVFVWSLQKCRRWDRSRPARDSPGKCLQSMKREQGKARRVFSPWCRPNAHGKRQQIKAEWGRKSLELQLSSKTFWPGHWEVLTPKVPVTEPQE